MPVTVVDDDGVSERAELMECPRDGCDTFVVFRLTNGSIHLQCRGCGTSYCQDGRCGGAG
jgi:hypothetical protein